jgi:hypothetical protein
MVAQLPRPGVEIIQEFRSTSPTIVVPTLVPCNIAPFFEIIEVLKADGTTNPDSQLDDPYRQLGLTISQSSFPSPRGNIDEVNVDEDSVRWFFNYGGALLELSRTSSFLASLNLATQPFVTGSITGPYNLDGRQLIIQLNSHMAVGGANPGPAHLPSTANVTIEFEANAMTLDEVIAFINTTVGATIASNDGTGQLRLTSTRYGAGASVTVRSTGSANTILGFSAVADQIAVGSGFYAIDDADGDQTTPRIEYFRGTTQRAIGVANVPASPAVNFTDYFIQPGDALTADGVLIGEVLTVFTDRLVMEVEQNIFGLTGITPFAPRYLWAQANNLSFPAPSTTQAATLTGSQAAVAASRPYLVTQAAGTYPVAAGESFSVDVTLNGVAQTTEVIGSGAGWANIAAAIAAINTASVNFEVYPSNAFGDEVAAGLATRIGFRTLAGAVGSAYSITIASQSVGMAIGFTSLPVGDVGENARYRSGTPAVVVDGAAWAGGTGATATETFGYVVTVHGVAQAAEIITWGGAYANNSGGLASAIANWNTQAIHTEAFESNAAGVETVGGGRFAIRTRGENLGTDASIQITDIDGPTGNHLAVATTTGAASDLNNTTFRWRLDLNPQTYEVLLAADEDDGGTSLQSIVNRINAVTPGRASLSTSTPPALLLTSGLAGEASQVVVTNGTANTILGFTTNQTASGSGRPAPDLALDVDGNVRIQHQILRNGLDGIPFANQQAPMHAAYRALRLDVSPDAAEPSMLLINGPSELETLCSPISTANPGAAMCFMTMLNAPGTAVAAVGVPEVSADAPDGTPAGYARCFEFLESEEVYALSLGTQSPVVHQAGLTHVSFMSEPENKGERILLFNPNIPDRRVPTILGSGNDANTSPTVGLVQLDVNIAAALIEAGLDPSSVNPATGAIVNHVYLDLSTDDNYYLIQRVENGSDVYLRTAFVSGDGNEDAFFATAAPSGVISADWSAAIRGSRLVVTGTTRPDKNGIAETVQAMAAAHGNRRGFFIFPDQAGINITGLEQVVPGYYAASCIVGMIAALPPQQGFTNYPIAGLTRVVGSNDVYSNRQLSIMAAGGVYILIQDAQGAPIIARHQLSTDLSSIETRELSITKIVDFTAKFLRAALRNFIGRSNITQAFIDQLSSVIQGLLSFLTEAGVLIGADLNNLIQDADNPDTVLIDITLDVPYPCNFIRVTLVV